MKREIKIFIILGILFFVAILGLSILINRMPITSQVLSEASGVEVDPLYYDLGNVPIKGGIITKEYLIKNVSSQPIKLKRIATSCMCTTASFQFQDKKTDFFGMEMNGNKNPSLNIQIGVNETGKVVVRFDPAAHGPQGIGPFDRVVYLTFSDPAGVKELKFGGNVVSE